MITIRDIHKSFGRQSIFEGAFLQINDGERFALVGPNGSGKSNIADAVKWVRRPG